jgi:hypothetical protein
MKMTDRNAIANDYFFSQKGFSYSQMKGHFEDVLIKEVAL